MSRKLSRGDRVRLTTANSMLGFKPGEEGTIKQGPYPALAGGHYYIVQMDNDAGGGPTIFLEEEIELAH
jgi:hypothetical protein